MEGSRASRQDVHVPPKDGLPPALPAKLKAPTKRKLVKPSPTQEQVDHARQYIQSAMSNPHKFGCDAILSKMMTRINTISTELVRLQSDQKGTTPSKKTAKMQKQLLRANAKLRDLGSIIKHLNVSVVHKRLLRSRVPGKGKSKPSTNWFSHHFPLVTKLCRPGRSNMQ